MCRNNLGAPARNLRRTASHPTAAISAIWRVDGNSRFSTFYISDGAQRRNPDYSRWLVWGNLTDRPSRTVYRIRVSTAIGEGRGRRRKPHESSLSAPFGSPGESNQKVLLLGVVRCARVAVLLI